MIRNDCRFEALDKYDPEIKYDLEIKYDPEII